MTTSAKATNPTFHSVCGSCMCWNTPTLTCLKCSIKVCMCWWIKDWFFSCGCNSVLMCDSSHNNKNNAMLGACDFHVPTWTDLNWCSPHCMICFVKWLLAACDLIVLDARHYCKVLKCASPLANWPGCSQHGDILCVFWHAQTFYGMFFDLDCPVEWFNEEKAMRLFWLIFFRLDHFFYWVCKLLSGINLGWEQNF